MSDCRIARASEQSVVQTGTISHLLFSILREKERNVMSEWVGVNGDTSPSYKLQTRLARSPVETWQSTIPTKRKMQEEENSVIIIFPLDSVSVHSNPLPYTLTD